MNETKIVTWEGPTDIDLQKMSLLLDINCVIELTNGKENFFSQGLQINPKKLSPILVMSRINSSEVKSVRMSFNNNTVTNVNDFLDFKNDCLYIDLEKNREQVLWHPYYYSEKKMDYVFNNKYNDFTNGKGLVYVPSISHRIGWSNTPFSDIDRKEYDLGCFGDSFTKGHDIPEGTAWPYQYSSITKESMANFGVGSLTVASIFVNLKIALKKHKFKKIIILLPSMTRCFFRIKKSGYYFRIPVGWIGGITNAYRHYTIWFDKKEIADIMRRARNEMVNGIIFKKEKRMLHRIKDLLSKQDTDYYVSSWDNDCYSSINSTFDKKNVIDKFDVKGWSKLADAGDHPHQDLHTEWVQQILPKTFTN